MSYTVDAVEKALALLFLVSSRSGEGVTQLAKRAGIQKARAHRLLNTLEQTGLIRRDEDSTSFELGHRALYLGALAQNQLRLVQLAARHLSNVGTQCNEDTALLVREELESVCIARWDSTQAVRVQTKIGSRRPLYAGASGKLLCAYASDEIRERVIASSMEQFTRNTITQIDRLEEECEAIVSSGYSVSFSEFSIDTVSVASPVRDANNNVIASLSVTCPSHRVSKDRLTTFIELIQLAAQALSSDLGYVAVPLQRPVIEKNSDNPPTQAQLKRIPTTH